MAGINPFFQAEYEPTRELTLKEKLSYLARTIGLSALVLAVPVAAEKDKLLEKLPLKRAR